MPNGGYPGAHRDELAAERRELLDEARSWIEWALKQGDLRGTNGEKAGEELLTKLKTI